MALALKHFTAVTDLKGIDEKKRRIPIKASTIELDRDMEIVHPKAFRNTLKRYLEDNPVILASHNYSGDSVGKAVDFTIKDDCIDGYVEFAPTPDGEKYWKLYSGGYQRAFSIGWMGSKWADVVDDEKNELCNVKDGKVHFKIDNEDLSISHVAGLQRILTDGEILETSVCAVPSNRGAISTLSLDEMRKMFGDVAKAEVEGLKVFITELEGKATATTTTVTEEKSDASTSMKEIVDVVEAIKTILDEKNEKLTTAFKEFLAPYMKVVDEINERTLTMSNALSQNASADDKAKKERDKQLGDSLTAILSNLKSLNTTKQEE